MVQTPERATRGRWGRWAVPVVAVSMVLSGCTPAPTPASPIADPGACTGGSMQIVAHEDDDLIFLSPDLLQELGSAPDRCLRTVYVTAGDGGKDRHYWRSREKGIEAAYARATGMPNRWQQGYITAGGHRVLAETLVARPSVSVVFLRLPDGMLTGDGSESYGNQSLTRLLDGRITDMTAVDTSATYTAAGLRDELVALLDATRPDLVRTTDYVHGLDDGDHGDHHATAYLTRDASRLVDFPHTLVSYQGYPSAQRPQNLGGDALARKLEIYDTYQAYEKPGEPDWRPAFMYRQYVLDRATVTAVPQDTTAAEPYRPGPGVR